MTRTLRRQDWWLYLAFFLIAAASLAALASVAPHLFWIQFTWFLLAFGLIFFLSQIDIRPLKNYRWIIFGFYLVAVLPSTINSSKSSGPLTNFPTIYANEFEFVNEYVPGLSLCAEPEIIE